MDDLGDLSGGRELSEYECYQWVIDGLRRAQEELKHLDRHEASSFERLLRYLAFKNAIENATAGLRGLGHLRGDMAWQLAVRELDKLIEVASVLKGKKPVHGRLAPLVGIVERLLYQLAVLQGKARAPLLWLPKRVVQ